MNINQEELQMILTFVEVLVAEVGGFALAIMIVLCMAGVLR